MVNLTDMKDFQVIILFMVIDNYMCCYPFYLLCFLRHGFSPDSMILGTMIPIPKDKKKSLCSSSNYRAIG